MIHRQLTPVRTQLKHRVRLPVAAHLSVRAGGRVTVRVTAQLKVSVANRVVDGVVNKIVIVAASLPHFHNDSAVYPPRKKSL